jgi:hypothetical protein
MRICSCCTSVHQRYKTKFRSFEIPKFELRSLNFVSFVCLCKYLQKKLLYLKYYSKKSFTNLAKTCKVLQSSKFRFVPLKYGSTTRMYTLLTRGLRIFIEHQLVLHTKNPKKTECSVFTHSPGRIFRDPLSVIWNFWIRCHLPLMCFKFSNHWCQVQIRTHIIFS